MADEAATIPAYTWIVLSYNALVCAKPDLNASDFKLANQILEQIDGLLLSVGPPKPQGPELLPLEECTGCKRCVGGL